MANKRSLSSSLNVVLAEASGELQFGSDPKKALRRIVRAAAFGFSDADEHGSDAAETWLKDYLQRNEFPANLLDDDPTTS